MKKTYKKPTGIKKFKSGYPR